MKLRVGDWVEVRCKEEILCTLDKRGRLEELPFMPQMFQYCGQRFKVYKRAHKTCDTVYYAQGGGRRLSNGIHLETRCDGDAYGGCQAACLIFWKEAWLKRVSENGSSTESSSHVQSRQGDHAVNKACCTEDDVRANTRTENQMAGEEARYICQATELPNFTSILPWWDLKQYVEDYTSGNSSLSRLFSGFVYFGYYKLLGNRCRSALPFHWVYDRFQSLRGGVPYPRRSGLIPVGQPTPASTLDLQPGELVRVKSYKEILATLDPDNKNRGLCFDKELVPFCGGIYRVRSRMNKFINEKTGMMSTMKTPAIIMENVWCQSRYSTCRLGCPRSIYSWWREIWLERVSETTASGNEETM